MLKQLKRFFVIVGYLGVCFLSVWVLGEGFTYIFEQENGLAILLCLLFVLITFLTRKHEATTLTLMVVVISFLGVLLDFGGNEWFNKPLEWVFSFLGQTEISQEAVVNRYGTRTTGRFIYNIFLPGIENETLAMIIVGVYRFFQYAILYAFIGWLVRLIPVGKAAEDKKDMPFYQQNIDSTGLSETDKEKVVSLIKEEKKVEAIKLVRTKTKLSLRASKSYVDWLEAELINGTFRETEQTEKEEPLHSESTEFSAADKKEVIQLIKQEQQVKAIKLVREKMNIPLKAAKGYVDWLETEILKGTLDEFEQESETKVFYSQGQSTIDLTKLEKELVSSLIKGDQKVQEVKLIKMDKDISLNEIKEYINELETKIRQEDFEFKKE